MSDVFGDPALQAQIAWIDEAPKRPAYFQAIESRLHPQLIESLHAHGLDSYYSHQAESIDLLAAGKNVAVVTGTNSGKSLCYTIPAIQKCLSEPAARCMFLFPTKALAQDQLARISELCPPSVRAGVYDGDTPKSQRGPVRNLAHIVLTNPDMLHIGILPSHQLWAKHLKALRLIVIDEMHVYRGVFGSHVGNILRRLLRVCEWHRSRPQIIGCSATIGNPTELFERLTGRSAVLVNQNGSPAGKRTFVMWNPPEIEPGQRLSTNVTTAEIVGALAEAGQRTLAFNRSRVQAELVLRYARARVGPAMAKSIESYRAGYTPKERRAIEKALFKGDLVALSATNAMELGVDVGSLDAVVINGYPGTASSLWQQVGRAGRGTRDGLAIFVARNEPLDQFFVRNPDKLMDARIESVIADPENPSILRQHLKCAAQERPIAPTELQSLGATALELAERMDAEGELQFQSGLFYYPGLDQPAMKVSIRNAGGSQIALMCEGELLGTMESCRALRQAHEGAVYLHRGATYLVESLDLETDLAELVAAEPPYYTQSITQSLIESRQVLETESVGEIFANLCTAQVTDTVLGFRKRSLDGDRILETIALDLPPRTYETVCTRFDLPAIDLDDDLEKQMCRIHGLEHLLFAVAPLFAGCDRNDLGSAWFTYLPESGSPAVFIFDTIDGGVGLARALFSRREEWIRAAYELIATCPCTDGCPGCLYSAHCEVANEALDKASTRKLLEQML